MNLRIHNRDRHGTIPHATLNTEHDFCFVYDDDQTEPHPITGKPQPKVVYRGLLPECRRWIQSVEKLADSGVDPFAPAFPGR